MDDYAYHVELEPLFSPEDMAVVTLRLADQLRRLAESLDELGVQINTFMADIQTYPAPTVVPLVPPGQVSRLGTRGQADGEDTTPALGGLDVNLAAVQSHDLAHDI